MARPTRGRRDAIAALLKLTRTLTRETSLEGALHAVTEVALEIVPADHASIRLLDGAKTSLLSGARSGKGAHERPVAFRRGEGLVGWVLEHRAPVSLADAEKDKRFVIHERQGFKVRSIAVEPLWAGGDVIGVLSVSSAKRAAFSEDDQLLVRLLANCSVSPIENARLRRLAIVDDLTLAFNHRYLVPRLREEMERARRTGTPLSFALLDLDHFKRVNDQHGHLVGDLVLRRFADRLRMNVRRVDVLIRRSGDEFVLLMPSTASREARTIAQRIQQNLSVAPIEAHGLDLRQTVSIGVATWSVDETPESLERRADAAMYDAKRAGRDGVVVAEPPPLGAPRAARRGRAAKKARPRPARR